MLKRNALILALFFIFLSLASFIILYPQQKPVEQIIILAPTPEETTRSFTGRMVMPNIDDFYVLENTAHRDLYDIEKFLQGRAAGLHNLAFKHYRNKKNKADIFIGLRLELDSLGNFHVADFLFSNTNDNEFKSKLKEHIEYFWTYKKSTQGKLDFWIPFLWKRIY